MRRSESTSGQERPLLADGTEAATSGPSLCPLSFQYQFWTTLLEGLDEDGESNFVHMASLSEKSSSARENSQTCLS